MSSYITVTPNEFDVKRITITEPKKKNEKWQSAVLFESSPFYLQTEEGGRAPFGIRSFSNEKAPVKGEAKVETNDYKLNVSLDPKGTFVERLRELDEKMIDFGVEHSKVILGQKYTQGQREIVRAMYTTLVKTSEEGDYPPRIQINIQKRGDIPQVLFYHSEQEEVEIESFKQLVDLVRKGAVVKTLVTLRPWFINKKFGISLVLQQIIVPKNAGGRPTSYAFNDKTGITPVVIPAAKAVAAAAVEEDDVEDVEDEENTDLAEVEDSDVVEAEEEEEEEEVPAKNVKKAVTPAPVAVAAKKKPVAARK